MIVLDSYAVLALLKGEPATAEVEGLLDRHEDAALTVLEVVDHLVRLSVPPTRPPPWTSPQLGLAEPDPLDVGLGLRAGLLRTWHYHRRTRAVSLADCVVAETARSLGALAASSDPHLLDVCRDEGIAVLPLPGSDGRTWSP